MREPPSPPNSRRSSARPEPKRQAALRLGISAETRAALMLLAKGYRILARRYKTPVGEIDIVARRRGLLVFVEVKARENFDAAAAAVTPRQQARIINAAQFWLASHSQTADCPMRFDAILVAPGRIPWHLENAFAATE